MEETLLDFRSSPTFLGSDLLPPWRLFTSVNADMGCELLLKKTAPKEQTGTGHQVSWVVKTRCWFKNWALWSNGNLRPNTFSVGSVTSTPPSPPWSVCAGHKNNIQTRATLENCNVTPEYTASSLRVVDKKKSMTSHISYTRGSRAAVLLSER